MSQQPRFGFDDEETQDMTATPASTASPLRQRVGAKLFEVGDVLDEMYEIRKILGEGGMGRVYEAHDKMLNRTVAIKVSWPEIGFEPLHREAQAMAALRGRGLPSVYSIGKHVGIPYCVMERLYGVTLADYIRQQGHSRAFTVSDALDILIGLADALAGVHRAGLVHRDLKPANVMLSPGNRVLLLDFGVFRTESHTGDASVIYGSPDYVAPEEVTGDIHAGQAHLADIYATGVIAFELLSGHLPFESDRVADILYKHVHEPAPRVAALRIDIPEKLDALVADMLAKEPEKRPVSIEAVAGALVAIQRAEAVKAEVVPRILVVDDDREVRALLQVAVKMAMPKAQVLTASGGEQALALLRDQPPDLILIDLRLPGMSGLELCMMLSGMKSMRDSKLAVVSDAISDADREVLSQLGVCAFLDKRQPKRQLVRSLAALLRELHLGKPRPNPDPPGVVIGRQT